MLTNVVDEFEMYSKKYPYLTPETITVLMLVNELDRVVTRLDALQSIQARRS